MDADTTSWLIEPCPEPAAVALAAEVGISRTTAEVLIRPEQIAINPPGNVADAPAQVLETTYFGHDAIVRLALPAGVVVIARPPGYAAPEAGREVSLVVQGTAHAFPAHRNGAAGRPAERRR